MKKKKGILLLNFASIMLSICAIVIGVYSLKHATLGISGNIGFVVHGVEVSVTGTLSGYAASKDDKTIVNNTSLGTVNLSNNESKNLSVSLGNSPVYFTDRVGDTVPSITLKLSITNNSDFKVRANVSVPNSASNNVKITADKEILVLDEESGTGEITYTFSIVDPETEITDTLDLSKITDLNVEFIKFTGYLTGEYYIENNKLYVHMGETSDGTPIRWYAIGKNGSAIGNVSSITSGKYVFISEYSLADHIFNNSTKASTETGGFYKDSDMQAFVNGTGTGTLDELYNYSTTDFYSKIDSVNLPSDNYFYTDDVSISEFRQTPEVANQKLWLISFDEYVTYFEPVHPTQEMDGQIQENTSVYTSESAPCYKIGTTTIADWCLRTLFSFSFNTFNANEIICMNNSDHLSTLYNPWYTGGGFSKGRFLAFGEPTYSFPVRPAFQITIG